MEDTVISVICKGGPYDGDIHRIGKNLADRVALIFNMDGKQDTPFAVYLFTDDTVDIPGGTAQVAQYKEPENAYTSNP